MCAKLEWNVDSGAPQGSALVPLLFKIYINDLLDNLIHEFKLYTDDGRLIIELGADRDDDHMQYDIEVYGAKSREMHLGNQSNTENYFIAENKIGVTVCTNKPNLQHQKPIGF